MKKMYVVFKTHFDLGFTDTAENVSKDYLTNFIPQAIKLSKEIPDKFVWTTGSWLIDFALKNPEFKGEIRKDFENALLKGNIRWHGMAATLHCEVMDTELFNYNSSISNQLDKKYDKKTIAAKMTDIPGHTISIVPHLAQAGIRYLHIGVNASSAIPDVPEMFLWRHSDGSEIIVHYAKDYGDVFAPESWDESLYFAHTHDNHGPPESVKEVEDLFARLKEEHPNYELIPAGLDDFAAYAWSKKETLPIVREEIGDSWIHGLASDSLKMAQYRILSSLRNKWIENGNLTLKSEAYRKFQDALLLIVEHTWGGNGNVFLPDYRNYLIEDFHQARKKDKIEFNHDRETMDFADLMALISTNIEDEKLAAKRSYSQHENTWQEQRDYITQALNALPGKLKREAEEKLNNLQTKIKLLDGTKKVKLGKKYQLSKNISLSFGLNGSINTLLVNGRNLIAPGKEFGGISYERFDFGNYQSYLKEYSRLYQNTSSWALVDFNKRGIEAYPEIKYELLKPVVLDSSIQSKDNIVLVEFDLAYEDNKIKTFGLPKKQRLSYKIDLNKYIIEGEYKWNDKRANRMPEAYWIEISLRVNNPYLWKMNKINKEVDPYNVVLKGNRNLHGTSIEGFTYEGADGRINIQSELAPVFSIGRRSLLKFDQKQPSINDGLYILLQNNVWGTNFRDWFEDDMTYPFSASFDMRKPYSHDLRTKVHI